MLDCVTYAHAGNAGDYISFDHLIFVLNFWFFGNQSDLSYRTTTGSSHT